MKRPAPEINAEGSRKRSKITSSDSHFYGSDLFDFPEHQRYIGSILPDQNIDERPGYIVGKIFLKYPESEKNIRLVIETEESELGKTVRLEMVFGKQCSQMLRRRGVKFPLSHDILLSLRGCTVVNSGYLSYGVIGKLKFTEKVLLKMLLPGRDSVVVDLWDLNTPRQSKSADSEWYDVPSERPTEEPVSVPETRKLSKKEKKRLRYQEYREKPASLDRTDADTNKTRLNTADAKSSNTVIPESDSPKLTPLQGKNTPVVKPEGPLGLRAGCRSADILYTPLSRATGVSGFYNVVGVVYSNSSVSQSCTGDHMCTLQLVDPDNRIRSDNSHLDAPVKVVCFAKFNSKWLPTVQEGDIVILHNVKASRFKTGSNLVGYHDKLQWMIYGRDGKFNHGIIPPDVPRETKTDRGLCHSPFLQSEDSALLDYCLKLRLWWNAVECKKNEFLGKMHQIGHHVLTPPQERRHRPWFLIKDATTNTVSNGYFNCIAEVVHTHRPDQACFEIYVTDYTSNDRCPTYNSAGWCPPGLAKSILRIELWDDAASFGPQIEVGDFYTFKNLRMREANNGYYEAKMKELKIAKLDVDDVGSTHSVLKGLLERRTKWAAKHKIEERLEKMKFTKIEDVEIRVCFNCIVEILHVDIPDGPGSAKVYTTDYTPNTLLSQPDVHVDDFNGLQQRVFKIVLRDSQAQKAKTLEKGEVYVFQSVFMKLFNKENVGDLGGDQRLIIRLLRSLPSHQVLIEEIENRKKLFCKSTATSADTKVDPQQLESSSVSIPNPNLRRSELSVLASPQSNPKFCSSVKQLQSHVGSVVLFRIPARVKCSKPRELWDYCRPYCEKCRKRIPPSQKACVACNDFDHEFISYKFNFNLLIEDEEGSEMPIAVLDEASFLIDLPRVNMARDKAALEEFQPCFEALAGNVLKYQDDHCAGNEDTQLKTPLVCMYGVRYEEKGKQICQLLAYKQLKADPLELESLH
ncbi:hypothetical protein J3R30DRAFT_3501842 [Lentinula aciculospora]|uniref:Telomeric single stranded DNA binding POT1/Cdc13 domain-containing protein n=1 Tax=Lentinula aciculospora TaxID=153920 RepID=A0A9W9A6L8_9AGAR|nr:hypothetical protein J3R30DRAFT_3501842 [Lentinula aciculospora]